MSDLVYGQAICSECGYKMGLADYTQNGCPMCNMDKAIKKLDKYRKSKKGKEMIKRVTRKIEDHNENTDDLEGK
jgi:hypothetical protein